MIKVVEGLLIIAAAFLLIYLVCKGKDCLDRFKNE
jgi:hypothetical protein